MAHIIDARGADGAIIMMGEFLAIPASSGAAPPFLAIGALRRNPDANNALQYHTGNGWSELVNSEAIANIYFPMSGGRVTGPATFAANVVMDASLTVDGTVRAAFFDGPSLAAQYAADLAERYHADEPYEAGTVLVIGGRHEVTACTSLMSQKVAGIVSTKCAYGMNLAAGTDETHPLIALKGRVPCKVIGAVRKGDVLVTSAVRGHACAATNEFPPLAVIGRALADKHDEGMGMVEVMV